MKNLLMTSREILFKNKKRLFDLFIIILGVGSLIKETSFSFNPIFLAALFLIYYRGITSLSIFFIISFVSTFFINYLYGLEIILISSTYLFLNYLIHKIKPDKKIKHLALLVVDIFLLFMYLRKEVSYSSIINASVFIGIEFILIISVSKSMDFIMYKKNYDMIAMSIFLVAVSLSFMFSEPLGLVFFHLVAFFVLYYLEKYEKYSFLLISGIALISLQYYSIESVLLVLLPLLFMSLGKEKYRVIFYLLSHIGLSMLYQVYFLYNLHFYTGLISLSIFLLIPKDLLEDLASHLLINKEVSNMNKEKVTNYLDVVSKALEESDIESNIHYETHIEREHCEACDHKKYCKIKLKLKELVKNKLTTNNKKDIDAYCLAPSRLTFALQEGYSSYRRDLLVEERNTRQIEQLKKTIDSIKRPLEDIKIRPTILDYFNDYGLELLDYEEGKDKLVLTIDNKSLTNFPLTINEIVAKYDSHYKIDSSRYDALTSNAILTYKKLDKHLIEIGEFSKARISGHNGDNYKIFNLLDNVGVILCDGMGSGEKAERNSKYLLEAFYYSLNVHQDYKKAIDDVNRLLRLKSPYDQFSTLDYAELDLRTLVLTMVKAGAYASFLLRNGKIKMIPNNSLPLGIIDEVNINPVKYQLFKGDILMIMSDGLGELFEKHKNLIDYNETTCLTLARRIYETISKHKEITDDATNIVIKIL